MKVETYLRMAKLPYENKFVNNPHKSPKRKLPYIKIDGVLYPDSELIIDELKMRFGDTLDTDLTAEQKATAVLIDLALCERLYWVMVYLRWQEDAGWLILRETMFGKLPKVAKLFIPTMVRKSMLKELDYQGIGRHSLTEIVQLGKKMLDTLVALLGDKNYFLGDKPTSIDATAYAFLANIIGTPLNDPLKQYALQLEVIEAYCMRMKNEYYADF
jgi:glutathione S-transferase